MFIQTYGTTLVGNGWSSINNQPLFNIMYVSLVGKEFLRAVDTSGHTNDAFYIADVMKRYLTKVGPKNVVQICNDNASVMRKAVRIVQEDWLYLSFQGCMAHALNLLLQDWGSPLWANFVVDDIRKIIKFIRLHHVTLALSRKHATIHPQGLSLLNPGATWFATNFLIVARVFDMKVALKQIVTDLEWDTYIMTLIDTHKKPVQT